MTTFARKLSMENEYGYQTFCDLARDINFRRSVYALQGTRYVDHLGKRRKGR
jgi:hypothetical protein